MAKLENLSTKGAKCLQLTVTSPEKKYIHMYANRIRGKEEGKEVSMNDKANGAKPKWFVNLDIFCPIFEASVRLNYTKIKKF